MAARGAGPDADRAAAGDEGMSPGRGEERVMEERYVVQIGPIEDWPGRCISTEPLTDEDIVAGQRLWQRLNQAEQREAGA